MTVTPLELFNLALSRHRQAWNWTFQFAALCGFLLTLLLHSYLMLAATLIFFGAGFFELNLPAPPDNVWFRFVRAAVAWEQNWIAYPWTGRKWAWFILSLFVAYVTIWALWTREPITLALLIGFAYLGRVVYENKASGIDP